MGKGFVLLVIILFITASILFVDKPVSATSANPDSWAEMAPMHVARAHLGIAALNGKIYAIGGTFSDSTQPVSINEEYNPINNTWIFKDPMPSPRCFFATAVYENKIYCIGGSNHGITGLNQVYDPVTDSWENKTSMPTPRSGLTANVVDDKIYLMGGVDVNISPTSVNEVYDPVNDTWTTKAPMPNGNEFYASAVFDKKIYAIGGFDSGDQNRMYDPLTDKWVSKASPSLPLAGAAAVTSGTIAPQRIYVFSWGGAIEIYDAKTDSWTLGTPMPTSREGLGVACVDDQFYVIGGETLNWYLSMYTGTTRYDLNERYTPVGYGTIPPKVTLLSPLNQTYNESIVPLVFSTDKPVSWTGYSLDGQQNVTITGNSTIANVTNGLHTLAVYSNDSFGNMGTSETADFTVTLPPMKQSETFPTVTVAAVSGAIALIVVAISLVYFKIHKQIKTMQT